MISFGGDIGGTVAPEEYSATRAPQMQGMGQQMAASAQRNAGNLNPGAVHMMPEEELSKTVAPGDYRRRTQDKNKTVGVFKKKYDLEPVVGWLVCIDGPEKGKDYHLWARINVIGRSETMDVCLKEDITISKENHARLAYDPKHNGFQLIPGDSTNNIYINDEPIYTSVKLSAYDTIEFGESKMVFVPFCNERFDWTSGLKEN